MFYIFCDLNGKETTKKIKKGDLREDGIEKGERFKFVALSLSYGAHSINSLRVIWSSKWESV